MVMVAEITSRARADVGELSDGHPIKLLLRQREMAVARQQRCMDTYNRARANAIMHRALARENEATIEQIDSTIAALLPKEDDDGES